MTFWGYVALFGAYGVGLVAVAYSIDWAANWAFGVVFVQAPNAADPVHLAEVMAEMRGLGSPRVRAVAHPGGGWMALEGSHRLAAAVSLGKPVQLIPVGLDERLQEGEIWDSVTLEPLLMPAREYILRDAGPVYRIPARRVRVLKQGVWG